MEESRVIDGLRSCNEAEHTEEERCRDFTADSAVFGGTLSIDGKRDSSIVQERTHSGSKSPDGTHLATRDSKDEVADKELRGAIIKEKFSRLEMEQEESLDDFSETCQLLSGCVNHHRRSTLFAGDSTSDCCLYMDESQQFEGCSVPEEKFEDATENVEVFDVEKWDADDASIISSELEEGVWMEVRLGRRRPMQGNKQSTKRPLRVPLVALFDAVDAALSNGGLNSFGSSNSNGTRGLLRGSGSFSSSRRCGACARVPNVQEPLLSEEVPTEADVWAAKRLQATMKAIDTRLENMERCVFPCRSSSEEAFQKLVEEHRMQLLETERKVANVISVASGQKSRPSLQIRLEIMVRRLLRLRELLQISSDCLTELDVHVALTGVKRYLKLAQGAAAKLAPLLLTTAQG